MAGILGLLSVALFIALIVGLVKPSLILRWTNKPTRLKVIGFYFLSVIITGVLGALFIDTTIDSKAKIESANKFIKEGKYSNAISSLKEVEKTDSLYSNAQTLIKKAENLNNLSDEEKRIKEAEKAEKSKKDKIIRQKEQLEREIKSIEKGLYPFEILLKKFKWI